MPAKFERCVQHVKDAGQADGVNPWAVCHASTKELAEIIESTKNSRGHSRTLDEIIHGK